MTIVKSIKEEIKNRMDARLKNIYSAIAICLSYDYDGYFVAGNSCNAAAPHDFDIYPWGNETPTCKNAVIMDDKGRSCGVTKRGKNPEKGRVLEVCSRGESRYGLCDMMGNAEEWVADWYTDSYEACGADCAGIDPKGPCGGDDGEKCGKLRYKVVRGGSWYWPVEHATGIHRRSHVPSNNPGHHFGFRCAATQSEMEALTQGKPQK